MSAVTASQSKSDTPFRLNAYQKAIAGVHANGDFAYFADMEFKNFDEFHARLRSSGDGLFTFVMLELADSDCGSVEEARDHKPKAEVGDEIHLPISTDGLGRIAAQLLDRWNPGRTIRNRSPIAAAIAARPASSEDPLPSDDHT